MALESMCTTGYGYSGNGLTVTGATSYNGLDNPTFESAETLSLNGGGGNGFVKQSSSLKVNGFDGPIFGNTAGDFDGNGIYGTTIVTANKIKRLNGQYQSNACLQTRMVTSINAIGSSSANYGESGLVIPIPEADSEDSDDNRVTVSNIANVNGDLVLINVNANSVSNVKGTLYLINSTVTTLTDIANQVAF